MGAHLNNYHVFASRSSNTEELVTLSYDNEYLDTEKPSNELCDWRGATLKLDVEDASLDKQNITLLMETPRSASAHKIRFFKELHSDVQHIGKKGF
jgi:hypothetical protein